MYAFSDKLNEPKAFINQ